MENTIKKVLLEELKEHNNTEFCDCRNCSITRKMIKDGSDMNLNKEQTTDGLMESLVKYIKQIDDLQDMTGQNIDILLDIVAELLKRLEKPVV